MLYVANKSHVSQVDATVRKTPSIIGRQDFLTHAVIMDANLKTYRYYDNTNGWHDTLLDEIFADSIKTADSVFEKSFGFHPAKKSHISCTINEFEGENYETS